MNLTFPPKPRTLAALGSRALPALFATLATVATVATMCPAPSQAQVDPTEGALLALPDLSRLEPAVADQFRQARRVAEALILTPTQPSERAEAFGVLARLFDAYSFDRSAETYYRAALAQQESFRWVYALAYQLQRSGQPKQLEEAEALYQKALQLEPNSLPAYIHLAEILRDTNRLDQAEQVLEVVIQSAPNETSSRALLGQIALAKKDYPRAVELLEAVLAQMPEANRLHYPLALAYRGLGNADKAAEHLALRGDVGVRPPDPWVEELESVKQGERVHILSGRMAFRAGRHEEAAALFQQAVEANPESVTALVNLGSALSALGRYQEAATQFQRSLEIEPENPTALFNLGSLLLTANRPDQALPFLAKAAELSPTDHQAYEKLGDVLARLGRHERALERYRRAIQIAYDSEPARVGEATSLAALGRYSEAVQSLEATIDVLGRTVPVVFALIRLLAASPETELRDGERALDLATKLYELHPITGHAAVVAESYAEVGQCDQAAEWQQRVIETVEKAGQEVLPEYRQALARYLETRPCRPPGDWLNDLAPPPDR